ncbi:hypothetical protein H3146_18865 [Streptomyces sp. OF3]|uniref:Uncharacterized protein n=1 Tax=Streptomyces alkaliterrae TaxID=2213162 RepID=A0A7W3ZPE2_9ACTN|nr:polysialyltransferase family glycosyltransferase [Streptomyces alkaliterrae]MBB1255402.1 hypothetical protein [Streptomyces alkaliterrae]
MPTTTQIFQVSTLFGAATLAAALDAGRFGPREEARRVLLVCNNAAVPETTEPLTTMDGFDGLRARFDETIDWNETIHPYHPKGWAPSERDAPVWERLLRTAWRIGDGPVELVVESIQGSPARALATLFGTSPVHVYADGLMCYGPTRTRLPVSFQHRVRRVLRLDLVPGLEPLLLSENAENGVRQETVPTEAFRDVLTEVAEATVPDAGLLRADDEPPTAVLLGQYLAALDILSADEEEDLYLRMLRGAIDAGHRVVAFKPHPTAPRRYSESLEKAAAEAGVTLHVLTARVLAETLYERWRPKLVVGCFSTAMLTAATCYGVPVARVGTELLLERLTPYENSNRMPVVLVDHLVPDLADRPSGVLPEPDPAELTALVHAVGYCMQAKTYPALRARAADWLAAHPAERRRYVRQRRLTALGLPGGLAPGRVAVLRRNPVARRVARALRSGGR